MGRGLAAIAVLALLVVASASGRAKAPDVVAGGGTTVVQAEHMHWPRAAGARYRHDPLETTTNGFRALPGQSGTAVVRTTQPLTGIRVRARASQIGRCRGLAQLIVKLDGTPRLSAGVAPGAYQEPVADISTPPGVHKLAVGLARDGARHCRRAAFIDGVTLVASQLFSPTSWRNAALAPSAPLDPDQSAAVKLRNQIAQFGSSFATTGWSMPVYVVPAGEPRVNIAVDPKNTSYSPTDRAYLEHDLSGVPLPTDAQPAGPPEGPGVWWSDHELALYQPSSDTLWEMYHLVRNPDGQWVVTDGGRITSVSSSDGHFDAWPDGTPHGVAGARISQLAGLQMLGELQAGAINHAVGVTIPHVQKYVYRAPALGTDGHWTASDAVPEGTRFRLPAGLDVDKLAISPYAKMVARAIQRYGLIVVDQDCLPTTLAKCPPVTFRDEDPRPSPPPGGPNPYDQIFSGPAHYELAGFPWDKLEVLPPTG